MMENNISGISADRYRLAFLVTLIALIACVGIGGWFWWRSSLNPFTRRGEQIMGSPPSQESSQPTANTDSSGVPQSETSLVPIQMSSQKLHSIGAKIGIVESKVVSDEIHAYGNIQTNERRFAYVQARFTGWIRQVYASATGDFIQKGQPLFTIYSPDLIAAEREYLLAKKNADTLQHSQISGVADGATSLAAAAKGRLQQFDLPESELARLDETGEALNDLTFNSPVAGYVTDKNVLPNMYVQPDTKLYTIADLSDVWVLAQMFQNDSAKVKSGDSAEVTLDGYPGQVFRGRVEYLLPQLDVATRTLPVRLVLANPGLKLRPGMYVNVTVKRSLGRQLVVPDSAVFHSGTKNLIFIYTGEGAIEPREVETGPNIGSDLVIAKGVTAGEQIVTSANFLIDSEAQLQAAAGAFTAPAPGAGQAASMNASPEGQAKVDFTSEPSPPQKGSNVFRVKLTDSTGKPITGAQVTVTFFMAAMPAMGMAAMKTVVQASERGGGMYEGNGALGSGGSWQVTITAKQNGQMIINKQLTVTATGGM
jgi:RND family efflux transporter MFP subunit